MADAKISALTSLAAGDIATGDEVAIVDVSASETKQTTMANLSARTETMTNKTLTSPAINTGTIGTSLTPTSNDSAALGSTALQFSDLFLAEGGVINFDNGDATITQVGDVVTVAGAALANSSPGTAANSVATIDGSQELTNKTLNASVGKGTWTASGTWTLPAVTLGGAVTIGADMTFNENTSIILDPVLSADGKYCGITEVVTAGETVAFGEVVYLKTSDSQWYLTDADADSTSGAVKIAIAVTTGADNGAMTVMHYGKIRADAKFPTLTVGVPAYVSTTAGAVQVAQPSGTDDVIRIVGYGLTGDEMFFNPSNDYITHT